MASSRDVVLIANCSRNIDPLQLAKDVCDVRDHSNATKHEDGLTSFSWKIDNKYYSADVEIVVVSTSANLPSFDHALFNSVDALLLLFDPNEPTTFEETKRWLRFVEKQEPNVLLLVCNQFNDDEDDASGVDRDVALHWCVHHSFELVELKAEDGGIARITEALQSNTWSGMSMKGESSPASQNAKDPQAVDKEKNEATNSDSSRNVAESLDEKDSGDLTLKEGESFESLFGKMRLMKEKAATLPDEERRQYAEKVALAFWHAMSGDEDDVKGIDDLT